MPNDYFLNKYGPLMTLVDLSQMLHRSYDGLRMSLRNRSKFSDDVNAARIRMGRRVYFSTVMIAEMIRNS